MPTLSRLFISLLCKYHSPEMKNPAGKVTISSKRRIELLSHYYRIDQEKRIVYLDLRFDKASDVLERGYGLSDSPMFSAEVLSRIGDIYSQIPVDFSIEIELQIEDYEGYDPSNLLERFNEALEINNYINQKDKRRKWLQAILLILAGIAILFFMGVGVMKHWFGPEGSESASLWTEVLDIAGWVFVWEAVTVLFLEPNPRSLLGLKILSRTSGIRFYQKGNTTPLAQENGRDIASKWEDEGKLQKSSKIALLLSSSALFAMGAYSFASSCLTLFSSELSPLKIAVYMMVSCLVSAFDVLAGLSGLSLYTGRNPKRKTSLVCAVLLSAQFILYIVFSVYLKTWDYTLQAILTLLIQGGFVYGVLMELFKKKKDS